jgi:aryl-alcohol dehydrogenase-like predicted oxidoreductase
MPAPRFSACQCLVFLLSAFQISAFQDFSMSAFISATFSLNDLFAPNGLRVGFGTNRLGSLTKKERVRLLSRVWDLGVRHFDTAPLYGSGDAESWLGEFLAEGRSAATITTKAGLQPPAHRQLYLARAIARRVRRWAAPVLKLMVSEVKSSKTRFNTVKKPRLAAEYRAMASGLEASLNASLVKLRRAIGRKTFATR